MKRSKEPSFKIRSMITSLHLKGFTNRQISEKLNVSETKVTEWILTYQSITSSAAASEPSVSVQLPKEENVPRLPVLDNHHQPIAYTTTTTNSGNTIMDQTTQIVVIDDLQSSFVSERYLSMVRKNINN